MSNITSAGITFEYGDREYEVAPMGLREMEYLETYVQGRIIAAGRESLPEDVTPEESNRLMEQVILTASNVTLIDAEGFKRLMNPAGMVRFFYACLKRKQPDVTLEDCRKMMLNAEIRRKIQDAITLLNPNLKPVETPKNSPAPLPAGSPAPEQEES